MTHRINSKQLRVWTGLILAVAFCMISAAATASDTSPADEISAAATASDTSPADEISTTDTVRPFRVAVVDFSSAEGKPFTSCAVTVTPMREAGSELSRQIAEELNAWPEYSVLDQTIVDLAISKYKLAKKGLTQPEALARLAAVTGADAVVIGQTDGSAWKGKGHSGASLYASMQLVSTQNADVLWSIDGSLTDTHSEKSVVPSLAKDMTERLYAQLQVLEETRPMLAYNTESE